MKKSSCSNKFVINKSKKKYYKRSLVKKSYKKKSCIRNKSNRKSNKKKSLKKNFYIKNNEKSLKLAINSLKNFYSNNK
jgi:hypothetical protein